MHKQVHGSDLHQILCESSSYVVSTNTGSFLQNSDVQSFQMTQLLQVH